MLKTSLEIRLLNNLTLIVDVDKNNEIDKNCNSGIIKNCQRSKFLIWQRLEI